MEDKININNYCLCIYDDSCIGLFTREVEYYKDRRINIFKDVDNADNIGIIYTKIQNGKRVTVHGTLNDKFRSKNGYYVPTCCIKKYVKLKDYYKKNNDTDDLNITKEEFAELVNEIKILFQFETKIRKNS